MNFFPSPPSSPIIANTSIGEKVMCGSCDKPLSNDWYCSDCHTRCELCNRFLNDTEYCTRCWSFDHTRQSLVRKKSSLYHHDYVRHLYRMHYLQQQQQQQQQQQEQQEHTDKSLYVS